MRTAQREAERKDRIAGASPPSIPLSTQPHVFSTAANKARKAQEKAARAEVEQGAAAAQAKATAVRRNVAQKAPVAEAPVSELQKRLLARQAQ